MGKGLTGLLGLLVSLGIYIAYHYPTWRHEQAIDKFNQGIVLQEKHETDLAEAAYKESLELDELAEAHLNLGKIYIDKDWSEGARSETQKAIALMGKIPGSNKGLSLAYYNLGVISGSELSDRYLKDGFKSPTEAEQAFQDVRDNFRQAAELDPANADAQGMLKQIDRQLALMKQLQQLQKASEEWTQEMQREMQAYLKALNQWNQSQDPAQGREPDKG